MKCLSFEVRVPSNWIHLCAGGQYTARENSEGIEADLCLKLGFFNPLASVKDRNSVNMILELEAEGKIKPGATIVEPTSGNTGIGLAFVCAARGYHLILTMAEAVSIERRKMLRFLGAEIELTPNSHWMSGAVARANELLAIIPGAIAASQFTNKANPAIQRRTKGEKIWFDTDGKVDVVVAGVGTGGTLTGCAQVLRPRRPGSKMIAVEPAASPVLSGGAAGAHDLLGIGAGFVPEILDTTEIDQIVHVTNEEAYAMSRRLARTEGIPVRITAGAAVAATLKESHDPAMKDKMLVTIIPSFAERYLSTELFDGFQE